MVRFVSKIGLLLLLCSGLAYADQSYTVRCDVGGTVVQTQGLGSTNKVEGSFPGCLVSVFIHGTTTPAVIFSDNGITPESNPFTTSSTTGVGIFYSSNGRYDVVISGAGIQSPVTISDVLLNDFASASPLGFCTVAFSATPTFNSTSCNVFLMVLTGNVTSSSYVGAAAGQQAIFLLQQDSGGNHTFTWPTTMVDTPAINQTANAFTNLYFVGDSTPKMHLVSGGGGVLIGTSIVNGAGSVNIPSSGSSTIQPNSTTVVPSTCSTNNFVNQINSSGVLVCSTVLTALTAPSHQFFNSVSAAGVFGAAQPSLSDVSAGTAGSGTYDFTGTTLFKGRVSTGLTSSVNGDCGFDSTNNNWHCWNGADRIVALFEGSLTTGDCLKVVTTANRQSVQDSGGPCAATIASVSHNFLNSYTSTTGVFTQAQPAFTDISGSVAAAQLPTPTSSTLGGVESFASVSHQFLNQISTGGVPSAAQPGAGDITAGSNGQCIITSGGVSVWGSCAGTAGVQLIGTPGISFSTFNANTSSFQNLGNSCASSPCFSAAALNTLNKTFSMEFVGGFVAVNTTETIQFQLGVGGGTLSFPGTGFQSLTTSGSGVVFHVRAVCTVTATGGAGTAICNITASLNQCNACVSPTTSNAVPIIWEGAPSITGVIFTGTITPSLSIAFTTASTSNSANLAYSSTQQWN